MKNFAKRRAFGPRRDGAQVRDLERLEWSVKWRGSKEVIVAQWGFMMSAGLWGVFSGIRSTPVG